MKRNISFFICTALICGAMLISCDKDNGDDTKRTTTVSVNRLFDYNKGGDTQSKGSTARHLIFKKLNDYGFLILETTSLGDAVSSIVMEKTNVPVADSATVLKDLTKQMEDSLSRTLDRINNTDWNKLLKESIGTNEFWTGICNAYYTFSDGKNYTASVFSSNPTLPVNTTYETDADTIELTSFTFGKEREALSFRLETKGKLKKEDSNLYAIENGARFSVRTLKGAKDSCIFHFVYKSATDLDSVFLVSKSINGKGDKLDSIVFRVKK